MVDLAAVLGEDTHLLNHLLHHNHLLNHITAASLLEYHHNKQGATSVCAELLNHHHTC